MDILDHATTVLQAFDIEPGPMDRLIESYFKRHRELSSSRRRCIAEAVFGVVRWRGRIDGWLRMKDITRPDNRRRILCYLLWRRPSEAVMIPYDELAAKLKIVSDSLDEMPHCFPGGEAAFVSFPKFLYSMLVDAYGQADAYELALKLNESASPTIRVNTLKVDIGQTFSILSKEGFDLTPRQINRIESDGVKKKSDGAAQFEVRRSNSKFNQTELWQTEQRPQEQQAQTEQICLVKTERSPFGFRVTRRAAIETSFAYRKGFIEIQDEASQLAVIVADPKPGDVVLDICAGAGGKSLMMAMLMENKGRIIASDIFHKKLTELSKRAKRAGVSIINIVPATKLKGSFDIVFIDAPCSGTGTLRRSPDLKWRLTPKIIHERVALQKELITESLKWVKPDGRIVYTTCSILPQENEHIVEWACKKKRLQVISVVDTLTKRNISPERIVTKEGYLKTNPRYGDWDGFFTAILGRIQGSPKKIEIESGWPLPPSPRPYVGQSRVANIQLSTSTRTL